VLQTAASYGDEIASHTVTHADLLNNISATQLTNEVVNSQSIINSYITNQSCLTLAYPNCNVPLNNSLIPQYYFAARVCSGSLVSPSPLSFMTLSSYILGSTGPYTTGASINSLADSALPQGRWCIYLIHAIDGDSGYSPLSSTALQSSVNYTSTNQSKFWVETFGNVVRYIKERASASVTETANTGNSITVQVTNALDNSIYNYPITLRRPLPEGWAAAAVTQNGQPITTHPVTLGTTNYVMFDVVPNGGDIVLTPSVLPFTLGNPTLTSPGGLSLQLNGQSNMTYALYSSPDLLNWLPLQTNTLASNSAIFTVDASSNSLQFYRARWAP
jgi:oligosaccharide reducing-end xylanase